MTAREQMVAGELYDALDPELVEARRDARALLAGFNTTGDRQALTGLFRRLADDAVGGGAPVRPPRRRRDRRGALSLRLRVQHLRRQALLRECELRFSRLRADRDR